MRWEVLKGDLSEFEADALVNAAGTSLKMGGGVAAALRNKGGEKLAREARSRGPVDLGEAVETKAYNLKADYVIHAAGQPHFGDYKATPESIRQATRNALKLADELGCESIGLPAIGCGIAGCPIEKGAPVIVEEINNFKPTNLKKTTIVAYSREDHDVFKKLAD